jgi:small subunit ribosomal protein S4
VVNGRKVNIPSFLLRPGDAVAVVEGSRNLPTISESMGAMPRRGLPAWLELDASKFEGTFKTFPARDEMNLPVQEQLVVEFYSK